MKTRKILFEVIVADGFTFPENDGVTNLHLWPVSVGKADSYEVELEFKWDEKEDVMLPAEKALKEHINSHFPGKDYKIYYWWWKD